MTKTDGNVTPKVTEVSEIAQLSPFKAEDLKGQLFAKGNMLGGAVPVIEAGAEAPWKKD
jgi:hypothetical protein